MLRTARPIPVGTANSKQKNRPKKAVFLLLFANLSLKTGVKNSYAPRVRLSGISERTRDHSTQIRREFHTSISFFMHLEMIQFFQ